MDTTTQTCFIGRLLPLVMLLFLGACEPSPEDRMVRAQDYIANGDYRSASLELRNAARANPGYAEARFLLGEVSFQLGDLQSAASEFERALSLGKDEQEVWLGLGRTLLMLGRAAEALERVLPNLDASSDLDSSHVLIGDVFARLGNADEAESAYRKAIAINPHSVGALTGLGALAASGKDDDQVRRLLETSTEQNPESATAWRMMGNYLALRRDYDGADKAYVRSIGAETPATPQLDRVQTRVSRTTVLLDAGRVDDANAQLEELSQAGRNYPILHFLRGRIAFDKRDYATAQTEMQTYLSQVPMDPRGQAILGAVHFSQNDMRQAELYLVQAVRANPAGEYIRRLLAETLLRLNKPEEALAELQSSTAIDQQDAILLAMLGRAEIGVGDTESAIRYFEESAAAEPHNAAITLALAATYLQGGRVDDAVRVLETMPESEGSLYRREALLIGAYLRQDERDKAISRVDGLLASHADDPTVHAIAGVLHKTIGNIDRAESLFRQALELEPNNIAALFNLGLMAHAQDNIDDSIEYFERLLDGYPAYTPGLVSMTAILHMQQRVAEMRPRLVAAIATAPEAIGPRLLAVRIEIVDGQLDEALRQIEAARAIFSEAPALDHLEGSILRTRGRTERALYILNRAASADPGNAAYAYELAGIKSEVGDYAGAAEAAREFLKLRPNDVRGLALLVNAEVRLGSPERVATEVAAFVAEYPDRAASHLLAGDVALASGDFDNALMHFETAASIDWNRGVALQLARARSAAGVDNAAEPLARWLAENPDDFAARHLYAQLLESGNDVAAAVTQYERLEESGQLNAVGLNNLAWQYSLRGMDEAVGLAQRAHELEPSNGSITDTLGWILFDSGQTDRAVELLREAAEQSPENGEIQFHLASALIEVGAKEEAKTIIVKLLASDVTFSSRARAEDLVETL